MPRETNLNPYEGELNIPEAQDYERTFFDAINNTNSPIRQGIRPTIVRGHLYDRNETRETLEQQGDTVRESLKSLNRFIGTREIAEGYWFSQPEDRDTSVEWALDRKVNALTIEESMLMANPLLDSREGNKIIVAAQTETQAKAKALLTRVENTDCDYSIENQDNPEEDIKNAVTKILNFDINGGEPPLPEGFDYKINRATKTLEVFYSDQNFLRAEGTRVLIKYGVNRTGEVQIEAAAIKVEKSKGENKMFYVDTHDKYSVTTIIGVLKKKEQAMTPEPEEGEEISRITQEVADLRQGLQLAEQKNRALIEKSRLQEGQIRELTRQNQKLRQQTREQQVKIEGLAEEINIRDAEKLREQQKVLLQSPISMDLSGVSEEEKEVLAQKGVIQEGSNNERVLFELERVLGFLELSKITGTPEYNGIKNMLMNIKGKTNEITLDQRREIISYLGKIRAKYLRELNL